MYLFEIASSQGHIGEQVGGDIENLLRFLRRWAYTCDYIPLIDTNHKGLTVILCQCVLKWKGLRIPSRLVGGLYYILLAKA